MPNLSDLTPITLNYTQWGDNIIEFIFFGYTRILGFVFWPIVFVAFIGYIYLKNQSAVTAAVGILFIMAAFTGTSIFAGVPYIVMFFQAIVCAAVAGMFTYFFVKRRK